MQPSLYLESDKATVPTPLDQIKCLWHRAAKTCVPLLCPGCRKTLKLDSNLISPTPMGQVWLPAVPTHAAVECILHTEKLRSLGKQS